MEFIEQLERTKARTLKYFELPDADLAKSYAPGKWSVRYLLNHLADSETVFFYRIRRVISEPNQVIWFYDQDAWAQKLDYSTVPYRTTSITSSRSSRRWRDRTQRSSRASISGIACS